MKATWIKVNGTWKQVKNVWQKVNGVWKQRVMPKGKISGIWRQLMNYYTPQIFMNSGIADDYTGNWLTKFDENLGEIFKVNLVGFKPGDSRVLSYTFIEDSEKYVTCYTNWEGKLQRRDIKRGDLIEPPITSLPTMYNIKFQMFRCNNLLFHSSGVKDSTELYVMDMNTNTQYCPTYKEPRTGTNSIVADASAIYITTSDYGTPYETYLRKYSYNKEGITSKTYIYRKKENIKFITKVGNKLICSGEYYDSDDRVIKSTLEIRNDIDFGIIKELNLGGINWGYSIRGAIYDMKRRVILIYETTDRSLITINLDGEIISTRKGIFPYMSNGDFELSSCDENSNLYFILRRYEPRETGIYILDKDANILRNKSVFATNNTYNGINITASRYKSRYDEGVQ